MSEEFEVQNFQTNSGFHYSALTIDDLSAFGASEYTVATVLFDWSGSVQSFESEIKEVMPTILDACKAHPRSENVLLRVLTFNSRAINEVHGFLPVNSIDVAEYAKTGTPYGGTPLRDATMNAIESLNQYAVQMVKGQFTVNAVLFVVSDGAENDSRVIRSDSEVKKAMDILRLNDPLESFTSILIGVNDATCRAELLTFKNDAGFDDYKSIQDVTKGGLAKMANFVSQSISTASKNLGNPNAPTVSQMTAGFTF